MYFLAFAYYTIIDWLNQSDGKVDDVMSDARLVVSSQWLGWDSS